MRLVSIVLALIPLVVGCDDLLLGRDEAIISLEENLTPPPALDDGWEVSELSVEGIDASRIHRLIETIHSNPQNIHSLIIARNGKLVTESYFNGWHRDRLHSLRSDSKSFISTLVGIAIDNGQIESVSQKVFDFFPEYAYLNNERKNEIEIKHILSMSAGLQWDESTYFGLDDYRNDEYAIERSSDRLRYLLEKEMVHPAGSHFLYNSGLPILQSAIIKKATGESVDEYAKKNLFDPLSIKEYYWRMNADGYVSIVPLFLRPRDMTKLGQVFLDFGKWKGKSVVSAGWVAEASSSIISNTSSFEASRTGTGYGYNWWTEKFTFNNSTVQTFAAEGNGGQYIFVVPDLNTVVVFTGGNYKSDQSAPFRMMSTTILPALMQ